MGKSITRVRRALEEAGLTFEIRTVAQARTAQEAADSLGCGIDQIAKSMLFADADRPETLVLFLTAGGRQVDAQKAAQVAGHALVRADGKTVRAVTGFAVGGVAPVGHLSPLPCFMDPRLAEFDILWAAAGTPRDVFSITPAELLSITNAQMAAFTA